MSTDTKRDAEGAPPPLLVAEQGIFYGFRVWPLPEMLCAPLFSTRARAGFRARSAHTRLLSADEGDERVVKYLSSDRKTLTWSCGSFNATGTRLWLDPLIPPMVDR